MTGPSGFPLANSAAVQNAELLGKVDDDVGELVRNVLFRIARWSD
jgi:hypothetical protein